MMLGADLYHIEAGFWEFSFSVPVSCMLLPGDPEHLWRKIDKIPRHHF
jgi:hypothetical protein